jgi:hypothetical protein
MVALFILFSVKSDTVCVRLLLIYQRAMECNISTLLHISFHTRAHAHAHKINGYISMHT